LKALMALKIVIFIFLIHSSSSETGGYEKNFIIMISIEAYLKLSNNI